MTRPWEGRFWAKIDKSGPPHPILGTRCWDWTPVNKRGRPQFWLNGKSVYAYRIAYEMKYGASPDVYLDHLCHRPICVRPEHLHAGTPQQNSLNRKGANCNNRLGFRGVHAHGQRFRAQTERLGRKYHLGIFDTPEQAAEAFEKWSRSYGKGAGS